MSDTKYPNWDKIINWLTAFPLRWTRLAYGGALLIMFYALTGTDILRFFPSGSDSWWLTIGIIIGAFVAAMTAPDPSKSEVLTLAEKYLNREFSDKKT